LKKGFRKVISSCGRSVPRGVRQRIGQYQTRHWGSTNAVKNIDYAAAVVVKRSRVQNMEHKSGLSMILEKTGHNETAMAK
jgi:hypothetical protein